MDIEADNSKFMLVGCSNHYTMVINFKDVAIHGCKKIELELYVSKCKISLYYDSFILYE